MKSRSLLLALIIVSNVLHAQIKPVSAPIAVAAKPTSGLDLIKRQMIAKGTEKSLGATDPAFSNPRAMDNSTSPDYIMKFKNGWVIQSANGGIHAVGNQFYEKASELNNSYDTYVGRPLSDETTEGANRFQVFEKAVLYYSPTLGGFRTWRFNSDAYTSAEQVKKVRMVGRFKITIMGFTCNSATNDDILERDGAGDEVFVSSSLFMINPNGTATDRTTKSTVVFGDCGKDEWAAARIMTGTKKGSGGINDKNSYPSSPYKPTTEHLTRSGGLTLPFTVFQGELQEQSADVVIMPSIWEWDGEEDGLNTFLRFIAGGPAFDRINHELAKVIDGTAPRTGQPELSYLGNILYKFKEEPNSQMRVNKNIFGDPHDRPIGMKEAGNAYAYTPIAIRLGYEEAVQMCDLDLLGVGKGIFKIDFVDDPVLRGSYSLYMRIEKQ